MANLTAAERWMLAQAATRQIARNVLGEDEHRPYFGEPRPLTRDELDTLNRLEAAGLVVLTFKARCRYWEITDKATGTPTLAGKNRRYLWHAYQPDPNQPGTWQQHAAGKELSDLEPDAFLQDLADRLGLDNTCRIRAHTRGDGWIYYPKET